MATTPQSEPLKTTGVNPERKLSFEERVQAIEAWRREIAPFVPKDWDLDAELEAEHRAVLAGHEI